MKSMNHMVIFSSGLWIVYLEQKRAFPFWVSLGMLRMVFYMGVVVELGVRLALD